MPCGDGNESMTLEPRQEDLELGRAEARAFDGMLKLPDSEVPDGVGWSVKEFAGEPVGSSPPCGRFEQVFG